MSKSDFLKYAQDIKREGIEKLIEWLELSDFFIAPASTMYHGNYEGGLCEHSISVFDELKKLNVFYNTNYSIETLAIVALFHDLCKVNFYSIGSRNVKDDATGRWEKKPFYKMDEQTPFGGHGSKSVFLVQSYIKLTFEEGAAINVHMGPWDKQDYGNPGGVYQQSQLAWMLHAADERATYYRDKCEKI